MSLMFLKSQGGSIFSLELYSVDIQTFDNRTEIKHTTTDDLCHA